MNLPNILALGLLTLAVGLLLTGLLMGASALLIDPATVIEEARKMGSPDLPDGQKLLLSAHPLLTGLVSFFIFAIPALFLGGTGIAVGQSMGRRMLAATETQAFQQPTMERKLQDGLAHAVRQAQEPGRVSKEGLLLNLQGLLPTLDPTRQQRLLLFLNQLSPTEYELLRPPVSQEPALRPSERKAFLGRLAGLFFLLVAVFFTLWPLTFIVLAPATQELFQVTLNMQLTQEFVLISVGGCLIFAFMPALFGAGLLKLSRKERQLFALWQEKQTAAEELLLTSFREHAKVCLPEPNSPFTSRSSGLRLVGALVAANRMHLSEKGKKALEELLQRLELATLIAHPSASLP